jgi:hypothetical protein
MKMLRPYEKTYFSMITSEKNFNFFWIPVFTGMTAKKFVIPAKAGIQFFARCQRESLKSLLKLA